MSRKCCKLDTCGEQYSSMCVIYTGTLVANSYITLPDCDANLNDVIEEVDRLLKELGDNDGVAKTTLTQYNCSLTHITDLINTTTGTKAKTADTIIALLRTICALNTRITTLENADIFDTVLPQELQLLILSKVDCLDVDPCNPDTLTLKDLLTKLIYKVCP